VSAVGPQPPPLTLKAPDQPPAASAPGQDSGRAVVFVGVAVLTIVVAAIVVLLLILLIRKPAANPQTLTLTSGSVVFSDGFTAAGSGWPQTTLASGSTIGYAGGRYIVSGEGAYSHFVAAPYSTSLVALAITVTATVTSGDPVTSGYGVRCDPASAGDPAYAFFLNPAGTFLVDRYNNPTATPVSLSRGLAPIARAGAATSVTGACIVVKSVGGRSSVRLVLAVQGTVVADVVDSVFGSGGGWTPSLVTSTTVAQPSVVDFTHFAVRNLDG
jgi:hypothetical protein